MIPSRAPRGAQIGRPQGSPLQQAMLADATQRMALIDAPISSDWLKQNRPAQHRRAPSFSQDIECLRTPLADRPSVIRIAGMIVDCAPSRGDLHLKARTKARCALRREDDNNLCFASRRRQHVLPRRAHVIFHPTFFVAPCWRPICTACSRAAGYLGGGGRHGGTVA